MSAQVADCKRLITAFKKVKREKILLCINEYCPTCENVTDTGKIP